MSLRDRIARVLCATSPANTEGSAFEDYAECNQREWVETADAILSDPEIAALIDLAGCAVNARDHLAGLSIADAIDAALARLEEARRD